MRRFVIAFGHHGITVGRRPFVKELYSPTFVALFGREAYPGQWS